MRMAALSRQVSHVTSSRGASKAFPRLSSLLIPPNRNSTDSAASWTLSPKTKHSPMLPKSRRIRRRSGKIQQSNRTCWILRPPTGSTGENPPQASSVKFGVQVSRYTHRSHTVPLVIDQTVDVQTGDGDGTYGDDYFDKAGPLAPVEKRWRFYQVGAF